MASWTWRASIRSDPLVIGSSGEDRSAVFWVGFSTLGYASSGALPGGAEAPPFLAWVMVSAKDRAEPGAWLDVGRCHAAPSENTRLTLATPSGFYVSTEGGLTVCIVPIKVPPRTVLLPWTRPRSPALSKFGPGTRKS